MSTICIFLIVSVLTGCSLRQKQAPFPLNLVTFRSETPVGSPEEALRFLEAQRAYHEQLARPGTFSFIDQKTIPRSCADGFIPGPVTKNSDRLLFVSSVRVDSEGRVGACPSYGSMKVWDIYEYCQNKSKIINVKIPQKFVPQSPGASVCD